MHWWLHACQVAPRPLWPRCPRRCQLGACRIYTDCFSIPNAPDASARYCGVPAPDNAGINGTDSDSANASAVQDFILINDGATLLNLQPCVMPAVDTANATDAAAAAAAAAALGGVAGSLGNVTGGGGVNGSGWPAFAAAAGGGGGADAGGGMVGAQDPKAVAAQDAASGGSGGSNKKMRLGLGLGLGLGVPLLLAFMAGKSRQCSMVQCQLHRRSTGANLTAALDFCSAC